MITGPATWASSMQAPEPSGLDLAKLADTTVREIVHLSLGGPVLRLHLSNAFGRQPLAIGDVSVARPVSPKTSAVEPGTTQAVLFGGRATVVIPAGAEMVSDPVSFAAAPLSDVAISFHLAELPNSETLHSGSRATTYLLHGAHATDPDLPGAEKIEHWYQLSEIDVTATPGASTIVAFGDSITDGHAAVTDGNTRWTDYLAARLQADPVLRSVSVANEGIGGNHLLTNGLGVSALARMDRDVLAPAGVRTIILLEGINDLGGLARTKNTTPEQHSQLVAAIVSAYQQIIWRAHAHGLRVIGATLTPYLGSDYYNPSAADEADRQAVNAWIRAAGHFDAVIDFDAAVRDPNAPGHLLPALDSGDHLHPGPAGYKAMAEAIPLSLFKTAVNLRPSGLALRPSGLR